MASMFRDFSFEAASRRPQSAHKAEPVCPTSIAALPPPTPLPTPPPCSVADLAHTLDQQSLRIDVEVDPAYRSSYEPLTPPSDDFAFPTELLDRPQQLASQRLASATLRMQRQANTKMQCTASHIKDISLLVRMLEEADQWRLCQPKPSTLPSPPPQSDEDEGIDMEYTPSDPKEVLRFDLPFWRAGERPYAHNTARISKSIRMRKRPRVVRRVPK